MAGSSIVHTYGLMTSYVAIKDPKSFNHKIMFLMSILYK